MKPINDLTTSYSNGMVLLQISPDQRTIPARLPVPLIHRWLNKFFFQIPCNLIRQTPGTTGPLLLLHTGYALFIYALYKIINTLTRYVVPATQLVNRCIVHDSLQNGYPQAHAN